MSYTYSIYGIRNVITGRVYVGKAQQIEHRWTTHRRRLKERRHHNKQLQADWDKHGEQAFVFEVLDRLTYPLDSDDDGPITRSEAGRMARALEYDWIHRFPVDRLYNKLGLSASDRASAPEQRKQQKK